MSNTLSLDYSKPYLMSREEWNSVKEANSSQGSSIFKVTSSSKNEMTRKINNIILLNFGVNEWLYNKACNGCAESLEKLELGYDIYQEIINKAKEEKLI